MRAQGFVYLELSARPSARPLRCLCACVSLVLCTLPLPRRVCRSSFVVGLCLPLSLPCVCVSVCRVSVCFVASLCRCLRLCLFPSRSSSLSACLSFSVSLSHSPPTHPPTHCASLSPPLPPLLPSQPAYEKTRTGHGGASRPCAATSPPAAHSSRPSTGGAPPSCGSPPRGSGRSAGS